MALPDITVQLAGESGEGVISGGDILTAGAARAGYWGLTFRTYPAEIKGGPCMFQLRVGPERVTSIGNRTDLLVCFNQEGFDLQHDTVGPEGIVVYDAESCKVTEEFGGRSFEAPLARLAQEAGGNRRGKNMVVVGIVCGLLDADTDPLEELILQRYAHKGDVGEANIKSLRAGREFARGDLPKVLHLDKPTTPTRDRILLSGNQAIVLAALHAGLRFYAGYPITPASDILELLAGRLPKLGGFAVQTEDEIAALAAVLGASFAGRKAMTATSGPGLSLMSELVGLAGAAEIPAVIIDAQRAGPSTGMPTKTEQSDLNHALYGGHGESPRVVLAPTSVEDCFQTAVDAFNIAERFQVPVILLSDQSLSHRLETVNRPDLSTIEVVDRRRPESSEGGYRRYAVDESGISPMSVPGAAGAYVSTGIEHDELGHPGYTPALHETMQHKRFSKLLPLVTEGRVSITGDARAEVGLIGWGSTEGAATEAVAILRARGVGAATFYPRVLTPLPVDRIVRWAEGMGQLVCPEVNLTGQFARLLRAECEIKIKSCTQITGLPFTAEQIADFVCAGLPTAGSPDGNAASDGPAAGRREPAAV